MQESSLTAVNCNLSGNVALGGSVSRGGLISVLAPSVATFESSQLVGNAVKLGRLESLGGALYAESGKTSINIVSGRLVGNQASGNSTGNPRESICPGPSSLAPSHFSQLHGATSKCTFDFLDFPCTDHRSPLLHAHVSTDDVVHPGAAHIVINLACFVCDDDVLSAQNLARVQRRNGGL